MLAVVASFAATITFSYLELEPIGDQLDVILGNAAPSIERLSEIQTDLMRLGSQLSEYIDRDDRALLPEISTSRRAIDDEIARYRALPTFPLEAEHVDTMVGDLALLDESIAAVLRAADAGADDAARRAMRDQYRPRRDRVAEDVAGLRKLNGDYLFASGANIVRARQSATRIATLLGVTSMLLAALATVLVLRSLRTRTRIVEERDRLLAARATELEAFSGRVAHDLRGPLAAIAMRLMVMKEQRDLASPTRDGVGKLVRQVERMSSIIDGLLEFALAGANPTPGAHANLNQILDEVSSDVRPAVDAAQAELEVAPFQQIELACPPAALACVLSNLMSNAAKYVVDGTEVPRRVSVRVDERNATAHVEVADNGPGIPAGLEEIVFEPFRRLADLKPGIGLGLATVKKIVEAYHGRVGLRSTHGHGCTFWFELPKAA